MGMTHYSILNCHPDVEFVAICDPSSFIRSKVEQHLGVDTYDNHEEMIDRSSPDFILISTPTGTHKDCALHSINNGIHMFMEKPLAVTPDDGDDILSALSGTQIVNQVGYVLRFNDIFLAIREILTDNLLGDVISFKAEVRGPTILRDIKDGWRAKKGQGGGCLHDFASHAVDLTCYLFGPPTHVSGSTLQKIYSTNVDDAVYTTLKYESGTVGTLQANWSDPTYRKPTYNLDILCKQGRIVADLHQFKIFFRDEPSLPNYRKGWNTVYVTDIVEPVRFYLRGYEFTRQLDYFVDQICAGKTDNLSSFQDGQTTDRIIGMIVADANS
jgi:predicted dehydrogenase